MPTRMLLKTVEGRLTRHCSNRIVSMLPWPLKASPKQLLAPGLLVLPNHASNACAHACQSYSCACELTFWTSNKDFSCLSLEVCWQGVREAVTGQGLSRSWAAAAVTDVTVGGGVGSGVVACGIAGVAAVAVGEVDWVGGRTLCFLAGCVACTAPKYWYIRYSKNYKENRPINLFTAHWHAKGRCRDSPRQS